MKIWNSYGSEHSANLVMIGHFRSEKDAKTAEAAIETISKYLSESNERYDREDRYSDGMLDLLSQLKLNMLHPRDLDQFVYGIRVEQKDSRIIIKTDEPDISAFLKLFIEHEAKVEVYSAHIYSDAEE